MSVTKTVASRPKKRRWLRRVMAVVLVVIFLPPLGIAVWLFISWQGAVTNTTDKVSFAKTLPIPALANSTIAPDGTRQFDLTLQPGTASFFDGVETETWGVNGPYLGPTLRAKRGEKVHINVHNKLPETSSLHWHGMHLPASMDGGPHQPIASGATWSPNWKIDQPAATLWYHPHPHGQTEEHVYRGIAGMFIIDDNNPLTAQLPHTYGKDDLPLIVQDKKFKSKKQLNENRGLSATGLVGNEILVNGARTPHVDVSSSAVRLRLLNGSTARIYNFGLSNNQTMQLVASDGGLLDKPVPLNRLLLSPGERAEVVIIFKPNEQVTLRNYPYESRSGFFGQRTIGAEDNLDIMQLRAAPVLAPSPALPQQFTTIERLQASATHINRSFVLSGDKKINGREMDMNRTDFSAQRGATEVWEVTNKGGEPHNFHVHGTQFQVLAVDGSSPAPALVGWKDTILLLPRQKAQLIMRFLYSDPEHPYMYHCHLLWHEDEGMMGQFVVTESGQMPAIEPYRSHKH